jgi:hypothetical protein
MENAAYKTKLAAARGMIGEPPLPGSTPLTRRMIIAIPNGTKKST